MFMWWLRPASPGPGSRLDRSRVRLGAAVTVELPIVAGLGDLVEVEVADDDLLLGSGGDLADVVAARVNEVGRPVEGRRVIAELTDLLADPVDRRDEILVRRGCRRLFDLPQPLGQPRLGGRRVEHQLRAAQAEFPPAFGEVPVVADVDPDPADGGGEDRVAEVSRTEIELLPERRQVRDVVFAVFAKQRAIVVDHRGRIVILPFVGDLIDRQHDHQLQLLGQGLEPLHGRAGNRLDVPVVLLVLRGAEVRSVAQLLEPDDLHTLRGGFASQFFVASDHGFLVASPGDLGSRSAHYAHRFTPCILPGSLPNVVGIGDCERVVQDLQTHADLGFGDRARRYDMRAVEVRKRPQTTLCAGRGELLHRCGGITRGVIRDERLAGASVAHQLDGPEHAQAAYLADRRVPIGDLGEYRPDDVGADPTRVLDDALILEDLDRSNRRRTRQRVTGVGEPTRIDPLLERRRDRVVDQHAA